MRLRLGVTRVQGLGGQALTIRPNMGFIGALENSRLWWVKVDPKPECAVIQGPYHNYPYCVLFFFFFLGGGESLLEF